MAHATGKPDQHIPVLIQADISRLNKDDKKVLKLLINAVKLINSIYFIQTNQDFIKTNGLYDETRGNNFYPSDLTRDDFEAYLKKYPENKEAFLSPFTNVVRRGDKLQAVPYSKVYQKQLKKISQVLEQAAEITIYPKFKKFLQGRARAFRDNKYTENDKEWVQANDSPFGFIIGPYESYKDELMNIKRTFEGVLGIIAQDANQKVQSYQQYAKQFDAHLGKQLGYIPHKTATPMIVIDEVITSGSSLYEYIFMACNLPNDKEIQQSVGSKKTFIRNVMDAKFNILTTPIAQRVLAPDLIPLLDSEVYFRFIAGHELSHGIYFHFEGKDFLDLATLLEEAKADIFGLLFLFFLADKKIIEPDVATAAFVIHAADGLRQIRFNLEEAHARGILIQYNWLLKYGAIRFNSKGFAFVQKRFKNTLKSLGLEFYNLWQTHDYAAAKKFVAKWGTVPNEIRHIIASLKTIPIDIDPVFDY